MTTVGGVLQSMAGSLDLWRDSAVMALAGIAIGALWLYASLVGVE